MNSAPLDITQKPNIACPTVNCISREKFNDGYLDGYNPFIHGNAKDNSYGWRCRECKVLFSTCKDNPDQITERSKTHLANKTQRTKRPNITCPTVNCISREKFNDGYLDGYNPFIHAGVKDNYQGWRCKECKVHFSTCKDNPDQITERSKTHLANKTQRTKRPNITCPTVNCISREKFNDGYLDGYNPFIHGNAKDNYQGWRCKECKVYFSTCKDNPDQITERSKTRLANKTQIAKRPNITCPTVNCASREKFNDGYLDGYNPFIHGGVKDNYQGWRCKECKVHFSTCKDNPDQITERSKTHLANKTQIAKRPNITCPTVNCASREKFNDGYLDGYNPFIHGNAKDNYQGWRCKKCKVHFSTYKDNPNQITERSKKQLANSHKAINRKRKNEDTSHELGNCSSSDAIDDCDTEVPLDLRVESVKCKARCYSRQNG